MEGKEGDNLLTQFVQHVHVAFGACFCFGCRWVCGGGGSVCVWGQRVCVCVVMVAVGRGLKQGDSVRAYVVCGVSRIEKWVMSHAS